MIEPISPSDVKKNYSRLCDWSGKPTY